MRWTLKAILPTDCVLLESHLANGLRPSFAQARCKECASLRQDARKYLEITLRVNGATHRLSVDTRTTLLDALREQLGLTSSKKGCDHGQCGARSTLVRTLLDLTEEEKDRR